MARIENFGIFFPHPNLYPPPPPGSMKTIEFFVHGEVLLELFSLTQTIFFPWCAHSRPFADLVGVLCCPGQQGHQRLICDLQARQQLWIKEGGVFIPLPTEAMCYVMRCPPLFTGFAVPVHCPGCCFLFSTTEELHFSGV